MLPNYFDDIFVHLRQKLRLRPELSPKFLSTLGPNPARTDPKSPARLTTLMCSELSKQYNVFTKGIPEKKHLKSKTVIR